MTRLLILERGLWYGWQMLPGYGSGLGPYFSPILLHEAVPLKGGKGDLRLRFGNAFYAQGVQDFELVLRVWKRTDTYLVGEIRESSSDRSAVVTEMSYAWLQTCCPKLLESHPVRDGGMSGVQSYVQQTIAAISAAQ